nr:glycosyltransferase [Porphyromonas macacae]
MVVVGRLVKRKNIDFLIRVFQECNTQDYELLIVGEGPEKNNLKCLAESDQNIRFLPFMKQSELRELYKRVSAFIIPSTFDTWGLVINEAMAAGLPVIASSKCGATEVLVKDGVNGYVFNPEDDGTSMKKKLDVFFNLSEEARRELGLASEKIISDWGIDRFAEEMLKAIDYAYRNKKKCVNIWDKLILNLWKGRYRQI